MASYTIELSRLVIVVVQVGAVKIYVATVEVLKKSYLYIYINYPYDKYYIRLYSRT
jgi:hypothetical protein